jgi:hypothetical protein
MILPTKNLTRSKALVTVGAHVLAILGDTAWSISGLWHQYREDHPSESERIGIDWFVLSLDFLFAVGAVRLTEHALIQRQES